MMKKSLLIPVISVAGGVAAFLLRFLQNRSGFESGTGLPVSGNVPGLVLIACFFVLAAALLVLSRSLSNNAGELPLFPEAFSTDNTSQLFLPVAGIALIALSGVADLYEGLTGGNLLAQMQAAADPYGTVSAESFIGFPLRAQLLLGVLTILSAGALLLSVLGCRRQEPAEGEEDPKPVSGNLLLVFPVVLVVRLVLTYRLDSVDPALAAYYVDILALVFLTLSFYRLSSFAFKAGKTPRFAWYTGLAVVFSLAALADGGPLLSSLLLYAGGGAAALGFLMLLLSAGDME